jgi:glycosyltransferase involved in cell wall biosynthesis
MRILLLAEGDPETWDSWSGSSHGLLLALRSLGHVVVGRDVSERGWLRWVAVASSWARSRRRWAGRYHFGAIGFHARTIQARKQVAELKGQADAVLQIGATFDALTDADAPRFLYCDANVRIAARNAPYGDIAALCRDEVERIAKREAAVYARATRIFTMSEYVRRSFIEDFGVPEDRAVTVYAGANLDLAAIPPREAPPSGPPTILFVGRQWVPKGGPVLLDAFRGVRQAFPSARLCIVGCAPDLGGEAGVEVVGRIHKDWAGAPDRLSSLYRDADLLCFPSHFDAFGIVLVEAMVHGLPCIGTNRAAIPEIIAEGQTGWLVPDSDSAALRERLIAALANRRALVAMGRRGRERALQRFTWERVAERIASAIRPELMPVRGRGP